MLGGSRALARGTRAGARARAGGRARACARPRARTLASAGARPRALARRAAAHAGPGARGRWRGARACWAGVGGSGLRARTRRADRGARGRARAPRPRGRVGRRACVGAGGRAARGHDQAAPPLLWLALRRHCWRRWSRRPPPPGRLARLMLLRAAFTARSVSRMADVCRLLSSSEVSMESGAARIETLSASSSARRGWGAPRSNTCACTTPSARRSARKTQDGQRKVLGPRNP